MSLSGTVLGTNTANLDAAYFYDNLGNATSVQHPFAQWSNGLATTAGPQYTYGYDTMNRLSTMTGPGNQSLVSSVTYNPANQIPQLNAAAFSETRTYNAHLQLTELVSSSYHYKIQLLGNPE
jgi:hypothetical protein